MIMEPYQKGMIMKPYQKGNHIKKRSPYKSQVMKPYHKGKKKNRMGNVPKPRVWEFAFANHVSDTWETFPSPAFGRSLLRTFC